MPSEKKFKILLPNINEFEYCLLPRLWEPCMILFVSHYNDSMWLDCILYAVTWLYLYNNTVQQSFVLSGGVG